MKTSSFALALAAAPVLTQGQATDEQITKLVSNLETFKAVLPDNTKSVAVDNIELIKQNRNKISSDECLTSDQKFEELKAVWSSAVQDPSQDSVKSFFNKMVEVTNQGNSDELYAVFQELSEAKQRQMIREESVKALKDADSVRATPLVLTNLAHFIATTFTGLCLIFLLVDARERIDRIR